MQITSPAFLIFIAIGLSLFHAHPSLGWKRFVLTTLSLVYVTSHASDYREFIPIVVFILAGIGMMILVSRVKDFTYLIICCTLLTIGFAYLKQYEFISFLPVFGTTYVVVGISYIFFRILHILIDIHYKQLRDFHLDQIPSVFNYLISFLTFSAGPIQRYQEYQIQEAKVATLSLTDIDVTSAFSRIATGYIKIIIVCTLLMEIHTSVMQGPGYLAARYIISAFSYLLYVYLNFSGYMDVMIGFGRLFGMQLPENFHYPLAASDFIDIWNRWHITLSTWFRDYVFYGLMKSLVARLDRPAFTPYIGVASYFVVFVLLGIWHGSGYRFIILGLLLAIGVSTNKLFEIFMQMYLGSKKARQLRSSPLYKASARALALTYLAISLTPVWPELVTPADFLNLLTTLGYRRIAISIVLSVLSIVFLQLPILLKINWHQRLICLERLRTSYWLGQVGLSARIFLIAWVMVDQANTYKPMILYRSF